MSHPIGPLAVSIFSILEVLLVQPQIFELYANVWHGFFLGFACFFLGFLLVYSGKAFWQTVLKWRWLYVGLAAILYSLRIMDFGFALPSFLIAIESNCWIFALFGLAYKYLNRPSALLSYLSQAAAYPIYIIHMFALYLGTFIILPLAIPPLLKFIAITIFTIGICFFIYEFLIKRIGILRPLFGMKWESKTN